MLPRTATQTLTTLLCAWVLAGCGAEGTDAPFVEREAPSCVRFDDAIASTLSTIEQGKVLQIEIAMEALAAERGDAVEGLLQGLLAIIAEMWQAGLKEHPEVLLPVGAVLHDFDALIASVMRFLAVEEPTQLDAREALSSMISECPQGSLTRLVALVVTRPDLIRALSESANDPAVSSVLLSLSDGSGQSGEEGFVALVRTAVKAINNRNFLVTDLIALVEPLFDVSQPPLSTLVSEFVVLLTGQNLEIVRAVTRCVDETIVVGQSGQTGTEALARLVYRSLTDPSLDVVSPVQNLSPTAELLEDPMTQAVFGAVLARLLEDDALREGMKPGVRFLLRPDYSPGILLDLAQLVDAGILAELVTLLVDVMGECAPSHLLSEGGQ